MIPLAELLARFLDRLQPDPAWSDRRLVRACIQGDAEAWAVFVHRYKRLVYAVAVEHGAGVDQAVDLFEEIWAETREHLDELGKQRSPRAWLLETARRHCSRWRRQQLERARRIGRPGAAGDAPPELTRTVRLDELEREQATREAIERLPRRCRGLVRLLFYTDPVPTSGEAAERLGLEPREFRRRRDRCLRRLVRTMERVAP